MAVRSESEPSTLPDARLSPRSGSMAGPVLVVRACSLLALTANGPSRPGPVRVQLG